MKLPLLVSVPHAGLGVPPEAAPYCALTAEQVAEDGDVGAIEIYTLEPEVASYATTTVARAIVDLNRSEDDRRTDGVVKTHTCWDVPVYRESLAEAVVETLLARYHRPYHARLTRLATGGVKLGVDCHTMAAEGPPVGPDPGAERPRVCLGYADGTCSQEWIEGLQRCFQEEFGSSVTINEPFSGGYITRSHAADLPWVQLELSRAPFATNEEKATKVLAALTAWCKEL